MLLVIFTILWVIERAPAVCGKMKTQSKRAHGWGWTHPPLPQLVAR